MKCEVFHGFRAVYLLAYIESWFGSSLNKDTPQSFLSSYLLRICYAHVNKYSRFFSGSSGELNIQLPQSQRLRSISIEHIRPDIAKSAPKHFIVYVSIAKEKYRFH